MDHTRGVEPHSLRSIVLLMETLFLARLVIRSHLSFDLSCRLSPFVKVASNAWLNLQGLHRLSIVT